MNGAFPLEGMALTYILVVSDIPLSRAFYTDVPGASVYPPGVSFDVPQASGSVSHSMTIRVPDCRAAYATLKGRGAVGHVAVRA